MVVLEVVGGSDMQVPVSSLNHTITLFVTPGTGTVTQGNCRFKLGNGTGMSCKLVTGTSWYARQGYVN